MEHVLHPAPVAVWKSKSSGALPSTRRLLDGVAMPVPHCSTEPARPSSSPCNDTLVDFHTGPRRGGSVNPETRHVRARARAPFKGCGPRPRHTTCRKVPARVDVAARSDKIVEPGAWSQVFWRSNRWAGAANREDGDYSLRADLVAFVDEVVGGELSTNGREAYAPYQFAKTTSTPPSIQV